MKYVAAYLLASLQTIHCVVFVLILLTTASQKTSGVLTKPRILFGGWTPILPGHPFYFGPAGFKRSLVHPENEIRSLRFVEPHYRHVQSSMPHHEKIVYSEIPQGHKRLKQGNDVFAYYPPHSESDHSSEQGQHKPLYIELPRKPLELFEKPAAAGPRNMRYLQHDNLHSTSHPDLEEKVYIKITPLVNPDEHDLRESNTRPETHIALEQKHSVFESVFNSMAPQNRQIPGMTRNQRQQQHVVPSSFFTTVPSYESLPHIQREKPLGRPRILSVLPHSHTTQNLPHVSHRTVVNSNFVTVPAHDLQTQGLHGRPRRPLINPELLSVPQLYLRPHNLEDGLHKAVFSSDFVSVGPHVTVPSSVRVNKHSTTPESQYVSATPVRQFNSHSLRHRPFPSLEAEPELILLPHHERAPQSPEHRGRYQHLPLKIQNTDNHPTPDNQYNQNHGSVHTSFGAGLHYNRNTHNADSPVRSLAEKGETHDFRISSDAKPMHEFLSYQEQHRPVPDHSTIHEHQNNHNHFDSAGYGSETNVQSLRGDHILHANPHEGRTKEKMKDYSLFHQQLGSSHDKESADKENYHVVHQFDHPRDQYPTTETNYVRAETLEDDTDTVRHVESGFTPSHVPGYLVQNSTFVITHEVDDAFRPIIKKTLESEESYIEIPVSTDSYFGESLRESAYDDGKDSLLYFANTPYSSTVPQTEKIAKNVAKHESFPSRNESAQQENAENSTSITNDDQKLYYNSRENALIEESSNFQKKAKSSEDKKGDHDEEAINGLKGSTNGGERVEQGSKVLGENVNSTNSETEGPQLFHAYYAPADHNPPEGYVRMSVEEFGKLFGNAEIHYVDDEKTPQNSTISAETNKKTNSA